MKIYNSFIKNFIYLISISILFLIGIILLTNHISEAEKNFNYNVFYVTLVNFIFLGGIGILLGLNTLNLNKKITPFKINISKLLLLGVPSFIFSLTHIWIYFFVPIGLSPIFSNLNNINYLVLISNIILGHTFITSISINQN